ncbi:DUF3224 domain-containing protein [Paenarthrobacter sp. DKR-5]|uniref:DUF3224 domain-containing protein n=1 Tax=Paenarthrobacter sp. DKR-5 TaxID=2835535 RepID=UPI001BDD5E0C|nr:DUF3224 domain-containing protein [Paenarthrobacter sp. DKR-5]MBT1003772.1 DUF3224 domain-containing protein [Paenarthrobacter sp. DKR-5]
MAASADEHELVTEFDVARWDPIPASPGDVSSAWSKAKVTKIFDGAITGTSVAEVMIVGGADGGGYLATELFTGSIGHRTGSMVIQHGGVSDGIEARSFGNIVPDSGTGGLDGVRGEAVYDVDAEGRHTLALTLRFG